MCIRAFAVLVLILAVSSATSAQAQGEILITQAKAAAGNVTPGDAADFPVSITRPGSYRLASNLTPGPNKVGIVVTAPDVTIDLGGFVMSGGPAGGANNSTYGILGQGDRLTVRNGTIGAFKNAGINAANRAFLIVEHVRIVHGGYGIYNANGRHTRIKDSVISLNRYTGILCSYPCHIENNLISNNGVYGVQLAAGMVLGNTIYNNAGYGIYNGSVGVGWGNNTLLENNLSGSQEQALGNFFELEPNACYPNPNPPC